MKKRIFIGALLVCSNLLCAEKGEEKISEDFFENESIAIQKLEETVISAENFETTVRETPKNITIITKDEIVKNGATDLVDVVKNVPGMTARKYADGEIRFDIRGQNTMYANRNVIVTVDGVPINKINGGYDTSQISIDSIERIEVIPGGGGVLYGDGALGGIINIMTKSPKKDGHYGGISTQLGSNNYLKSNFYYGIALTDNLLTEIGFTDLKSDGWRKDEKDDKQNIRLKTKYLLKSGDLEFKYNRSEKDYKLGTTIPYYMIDDRTQVNNWSQGKSNDDDFYLKYRQDITKELELLVYGNYYQRDNDSYDKKTNNYYRKSEEKRSYSKAQLKYNYRDDSYLILGGDFKDSSYLDIKNNKESIKKNYGGFILNKLTLGNFQFTQGYRRDYADYDFWYSNSNLIPDKNRGKQSHETFTNDSIELGLNYLYSDTGSSFITYTRSFRTPTASEIGFWLGPVKPQIDDTIEIGLKDYLGNTYTSASIFYKKTNDQIHMAIPDDPNYWQDSVNFGIGDVEKYGGELLLEHYINKLTLRSSVTYIEHEVVSGKYKGNKIPSVPNLKATAGGSYNFMPNMTLNLDALYHGKMYDLDDLSNARGENVDDYITVDLSLFYKIENGITFTARINNLFDEGYDRYVGAWEDFSQTGTPIVRQHLPAPGRTYSVGVKYSF